MARPFLFCFVASLIKVACFYFVISQNWNTLPEVGKLLQFLVIERASEYKYNNDVKHLEICSVCLGSKWYVSAEHFLHCHALPASGYI